MAPGPAPERGPPDLRLLELLRAKAAELGHMRLLLSLEERLARYICRKMAQAVAGPLSGLREAEEAAAANSESCGRLICLALYQPVPFAALCWIASAGTDLGILSGFPAEAFGVASRLAAGSPKPTDLPLLLTPSGLGQPLPVPSSLFSGLDPPIQSPTLLPPAAASNFPSKEAPAASETPFPIRVFTPPFPPAGRTFLTVWAVFGDSVDAVKDRIEKETGEPRASFTCIPPARGFTRDLNSDFASSSTSSQPFADCAPSLLPSCLSLSIGFPAEKQRLTYCEWPITGTDSLSTRPFNDRRRRSVQ